MPSALLPLATINQVWFALPLIVVISLVYSGTRHEAMRSILSHATRLGLMIAGFMAAIMVALAVVSARL
jgi:spore maturation protein SpmA